MSYRELDDASNRLAQLASRRRVSSPGDHIAMLMENNLRYLEVAWAAQRSGLYYTAVNSHLRQAEVQYILDDCGAKALVTSSAMATAVGALDLSRVPSVVSASAEILEGFTSYEAATASQPAVAHARRVRGPRDALLVGHDREGRKGVQKQLPLTPLGDMSAAPVLIASRMALSGAGPGAVYLSPAPLYHSAPLVYSMSMIRLGAAVVVMERFDAVAMPGADREAPGHARAIRPDDVHAPAWRFHRASARATTSRASGTWCMPRRPCPVDGEAADARMVGPDHPRVLRGNRGRRFDLDHGRGMVGAPGICRQARSNRPTSSGPMAPSSRSARRGSCTSRAAGPSSTTTTRMRPRR